MPTRRCTFCSVSYPVGQPYVKCLVCGRPCKLWPANSPDADWRSRVDFITAHANWQNYKADEDVVKLHSWRFSQLVDAGFTTEDAKMMAEDAMVDLAQARHLTQSGCDPELAMKILL